MRIGIISDVHSNLEALKVVLNTMKRLRVDSYVCLGDLVGYGANPNEVMDLLVPLLDKCVIGNHDAAVCGKMDYQYYYESAKDALDWTKNELSKTNLDYLAKLPYLKMDDKICLVHGEPIAAENFRYLYTMEQATDLLGHYHALSHVTFVGHSHLRRVFELSEHEVIEVPVDNITLREDRKYAIAVGSVGQPRNYDPRACFVIFDEDTLRVEFYRIEYDVDSAAEKIMNTALPSYFAERLFSGS